MRTWRLDLDSDQHAPRLVRHGLDAWLAVLGGTDIVRHGVIVVASEFVTAAVTSHATAVSVRVLFDDGRLRIDVRGEGCDGVETDPHRHDDRPRSLADRIIDAASDDWGRSHDPHGTTMWAEILC